MYDRQLAKYSISWPFLHVRTREYIHNSEEHWTSFFGGMKELVTTELLV